MRLRTMVSVALVSLLLAGNAPAQAFFNEGRFAVRKVQGVCKLEITITKADQVTGAEKPKEPPAKEKATKEKTPPAKKGAKEAKPEEKKPAKEEPKAAKSPEKTTVAILTLFTGEEYYSELITDRKEVGATKDVANIGFDDIKPAPVKFVPGSEGKDDHWRWQYLEDSKGLLENVGRRSVMHLNFSNGKDKFIYEVPLKGSTKAVSALKKCK